MDKICEMKTTLENYICAQINGNLEAADTKELGEAIDMIKDLAEAEYYCKVTEAMNEAAEESYGMGYTPNRYTYSGRRGMGFHPMEKEYIDGYIHSPQEFRDNMRMGYHGENSNRYGIAYSDWNNARRHYTETHNQSDKNEMNVHTNEHISDVMLTIKEMWMEADPNLRNDMKSKLQQLLNDLK